MNKFGFAGGTSQAHVAAAIHAYRRFEELMATLTAEEKAQVIERAPVCGIADMAQWGDW